MKVKASSPPVAPHWDGPPLEAWRPWRPRDVAERLGGVAADWCVVGGWAIDLFLRRQTREHEDLEIAVPRGQFAAVRARLDGFVIHSVGSGEVRRLPDGREPPADLHQNWVLDPAAQAWRVDVMLEPGDSKTWIYRRDPTITRPRRQMIGRSRGIPYLRPEGALLFKAKSTPRPKDLADFNAVLPRLNPRARRWLRRALSKVEPDHAWLEALG